MLWTVKKWLVDFNAGKTRLVSFDKSKINGSIDMKIDGSVLFFSDAGDDLLF